MASISCVNDSFYFAWMKYWLLVIVYSHKQDISRISSQLRRVVLLLYLTDGSLCWVVVFKFTDDCLLINGICDVLSTYSLFRMSQNSQLPLFIYVPIKTSLAAGEISPLWNAKSWKNVQTNKYIRIFLAYTINNC